MGFSSSIPWAPLDAIPELLACETNEPASDAPLEFTFLDCGSWTGDDRMLPAQRSFGVVCGGTAVLCELTGAEPLDVGPRPGPPDEVAHVERLLAALAGPQRSEVRVLRWSSSPNPRGGEPARPYVVLPEMRLPLVTKMPELQANLVPDPTQATCFCHGPIIERFIRGAPAASQYRAVGCQLGRDPNEWFYGMTEHFDEPAEDLVKLLARVKKVRGGARPKIVQLGEMFEIWAGFSCCFQSSGRSAMVLPRIVRGGSLSELCERWLGVTMETPAQRALRAVAQLAADEITFASHDPKADAPPGLECNAPAPHPETHQPPFGMFGLLEQQQVFSPWKRLLDARGRGAEIADAVQRYRSRSAGGGFRVFASSGSQVPCLTRVMMCSPLGSPAVARPCVRPADP